MNERDVELAMKAGFIDRAAFNHAEQLKRFASLIREDEREVCAKVCDEVAESLGDAGECATEIRGRGSK